MTLYFGPELDSEWNLYHYELRDGKNWVKVRLGKFTPSGFVTSDTSLFTDQEAKDWKSNEPNFPKPIAKPMHPTKVNRDDDPSESYQNRKVLGLLNGRLLSLAQPGRSDSTRPST
jgi:hypothetical protein